MSEESDKEKFLDDNIDQLNDETFGDGAIADDWESFHISNTNLEKDVTPEEPKEVLSKFQDIKLKDLWDAPDTLAPPTGSPSNINIWSSPELPSARKPFSKPQGVPNVVRTVEELEKDLLSSSLSPSPPPSTHQSSSPSLPPAPTHPRLSSSPSSLPQHHHLSSSPTNVYHSPPPPPPHPIPQHHPFYARPHIVYYPGPQRGPPVPRPHRVLLPPPLPPHLMRGTLPPNVPLVGPPPHLVPRGFPPPHHHPPLHMMGYRPYPGPHPPPPTQPAPAPPSRYPPKLHEMLVDLKPDGSGFMSNKEKEWVIKVQLLQLHNTSPDIEDYYYQRYVRKRFQETESKGEGVVSSDNKIEDMPLPPPVNKEEKKRNQLEFENTLGKLSVGSVTAPRRSIDINNEGIKKESQVTGSKKRLILLTIEQMYDMLLKLEDNETTPTSHDISSEIFKLTKLQFDDNGAVIKDSEAFLQQVLYIRKGKRVLQRILPYLSDLHSKGILWCIIDNIASIIKKDANDKVLPDLLPSVNGVILKLSIEEIMDYLKVLRSTFNAKVAENQFLLNVLSLLVSRGNTLTSESHDQSTEWSAVITQLHLLKIKSPDIVTLLGDVT